MKSRIFLFGVVAICAASPVSAQVCTSYPYQNVAGQILNGYTADASQIWADFSYIGGCAAPTANPIFTGNVGIGNPSPVVELAVGGTYTTTSPNQVTFAGTLVSSVTGTQSGTVLATVFNPSAPISQAEELNVTAPVIGTNSIGTVIGISSAITLQSGYSGALNIGNEFVAGNPNINNGASITNLRGYVSPAFSNGNGATSGTITNIGYLANAPTASAAGGTVNNYDVKLILPNAPASAGTNHNYALYINGNGSTGAGTTNNYAIYSDSTANSYLAGSLGVGTASPSALVHAYQNTAADDYIIVQNAYSGNGAYLKTWANSNWSNYQSAGTGVLWTVGQAGTTSFQIQDATDSTLPFTIVKGAPSNSVYVNASGYVGIGTATPGWPMDVENGAGAMFGVGILSVAGASPTATIAGIKLTDTNQNGTAGVPYLAIGDYWGGVQPGAWNIGSVTNSASGTAKDIAFQVENSGTRAIAMIIKTSGNVGIGTTTPAQALEVNGEVQVDTFATATSVNLCLNGNVLATCSSSIRYKENVKDAPFGLDEVMKMRPVTFKWKGRNENDFGLIAEEVAKINPLFVTYRNGKIEGVKYPQLTAVLVGAVKSLREQVTGLQQTGHQEAEAQEQKFSALQNQNAELRAALNATNRRLTEIESRIASRSATRNSASVELAQHRE